MNKVFNSSNFKAIGYAASRNRDKIIKWCTLGVGIAGFTAYSMCHSFAMDKYRAVWAHYDMSVGKEASLSPQLQKLTEEVLQDAHIPGKYKFLKLVRFFPCIGMEIFSAGSLETTMGCMIGIPFNFRYESVKDVNTSEIAILGHKQEGTPWKSEAGQRLQEALVLSENAKKFAIAKEIHLTNTFRVHLNSLAIIFSIVAGGCSGSEIITRYRLEKKSALIKSIIYVGGVLFGVLVWCAFHDVTNRLWQLKADEMAVLQGKDYYDGALEYYKKIRERNKALRDLFGEEGAKMFNREGDVRSIRKKYIPYKTRIAKINAAAAKIVEEEDEEEEEDEK